jgi:hypothetical protein
MNSPFGPNPRCGPVDLTARAACAAQLTGAVAQRTHGRAPRSGSKPDPLSQIRPDRRLTRLEPVIIPVKPFVQNRVYPLPNFFRIFAR